MKNETIRRYKKDLEIAIERAKDARDTKWYGYWVQAISEARTNLKRAKSL